MRINLKITAEILKLIAEIDEFKGRWIYTETTLPDRLDNLKKIATIQSIGSSTRIEGAKLSDQEIEKFLADLEFSSFHSRDEEEVKGYAEALQVIFDSYPDIPFTENYIKQLHGILLRYSSKDTSHKGEYKKLPNNVAAFDASGKSQKIIFETASPFETPRLMQELVLLIQQELAKSVLHPLLCIAFFIVHFLAIHPFQDGNGRLSRILTTYLLLQQGYLFVPYCSLEHIVEENKQAYYLSLRKAQKDIRTEREDLNDWLIFFFKALRQQTIILEKNVSAEYKLNLLPGLSEKILQLVRQHGRVTNANIVKAFAANRNTVKAQLSQLVKNNYLKKHGRGKGTWYSL